MGLAALYRLPCKWLLDHASRDAPCRPTANGRQGASFFHDAGIFDDRKYRGELEAVSHIKTIKRMAQCFLLSLTQQNETKWKEHYQDPFDNSFRILLPEPDVSATI